MDDFTSAVAAILKEAQQKPGQPSYRKLAEVTSLSLPTVQRLLNGKRDLNVRYLRAFCIALGLNAGDVVAEANKTAAAATSPSASE